MEAYEALMFLCCFLFVLHTVCQAATGVLLLLGIFVTWVNRAPAALDIAAPRTREESAPA